MKRNVNSKETKMTVDTMVSGLSENDLLDLNSMMCIRGGDGNGSEPILPPPPPPLP